MQIDPSQQTVKENYKLMIGTIVPRPIAFVSSQSKSGIRNLAPFSYFTAVSAKPPAICFSAARKGLDGTKKDTLSNIEETGEFVVNVVTEDIAGPMNDSAGDFPPDVDEFAHTGLTPVASRIVSAPRVKESPVNMECKLIQVIHIGPEAAGGGSLIIGEIVLFHIADYLYSDGKINMEMLKPVGRLAGLEYTTLGRRFVLERKK